MRLLRNQSLCTQTAYLSEKAVNLQCALDDVGNERDTLLQRSGELESQTLEHRKKLWTVLH